MSDDDIATMTYERAVAELEEIINRLETGAVALDDAIAAYERGVRLSQRCAELLDRTEQRVSQLVVGPGGSVGERPLDPGAPGGQPPAPGGGRPPARPPAGPAEAPALFPGLGEPAARGEGEPPVDPDDIPF